MQSLRQALYVWQRRFGLSFVYIASEVEGTPEKVGVVVAEAVERVVGGTFFLVEWGCLLVSMGLPGWVLVLHVV